MANLAGVVADDPKIRSAFLSSIETLLAPFEGLDRGLKHCDPLAVAWAVSPTVPAVVESSAGASCLTLGSPSENYCIRAGYREQTLTIESDPLGLLPVYYISLPDRIFFATSPHLLSAAPGFRRELDIEALIQLLYLGAIPHGRTLLRGIRRLPPGTVLGWQKGREAKEATVYRFHPSDRYFGNSFEKNLEIVDGMLSQAVRRRISAGAKTLLLSGGLDSRLLAGYAAETGTRMTPFTQGREQDFEMNCARGVADALGWDLHRVADDERMFLKTANLKLDYEYLAGGFHVTPFPQLISALRAHNNPVIAGVHGDGVIGCRELDADESWGYDFETHMGSYTHIYFTPDEVSKLLRPGIASGAIQDVFEEFRREYDSFPGTPFQKAWRFDLSVDLQKIAFPRYLSFGARTLLPYTDRPLIEAIAGMPPGHIALRRMQRRILFERFPKLALLPLDRNSYSNPPAIGPKRVLFESGYNAMDRASVVLAHAWSPARATLDRAWDLASGKERRFYHRTLGFYLPCWRPLREEAARSLDALAPWFDLRVFERHLREPEGFDRAQRVKILTGLALWFKRVLA